MNDFEKIAHLKKTISEIDANIARLSNEILEQQAAKTKIIDELKSLGCDTETDILYYPETGCIIV